MDGWMDGCMDGFTIITHLQVCIHIWGVPYMRIPQNGWFLMNKTIEIDDLGSPPFMETFMQICNPIPRIVKHPSADGPKRWFPRVCSM